MSGLFKWALAWVRIELVLARTTFRNSLGLASAKRFFLNSQIRLLVLLANSFAASFLPCVRNFLRLARRHFTKGVKGQHRVVPKWQFWPGHTADTDKIAYNLSVKGNQSVDANRLMILTQQTNDPGFTASLRLCQLAKQLKTHFSSVQIALLTYLLTYLLTLPCISCCALGSDACLIQRWFFSFNLCFGGRCNGRAVLRRHFTSLFECACALMASGDGR